MDFGMLWRVDKKNQPLQDAVQEAVNYYQAKYGQAATECDLNPRDLPPDAPKSLGAVALKPNRSVIRGHLWLGQAEHGHGG